MLFAQLAKEDINIHINIATIVIETAPHAFNINLNVRKSSGKSKLDSIVQTIKKHKSVFTTDTFDFFHFATTEKWTEDVENRQGLSTEWFSAYSQRIAKTSLKYWKYAGSIVRHEKNVQDYIVAAREIAYLMEIKYEVKTRNCHGVIQGYNPSSCLKWSRKTIKGFKRYISESRNRCFLLNYPRSLHPHNIPVELISPTKQCSCYNQEFHYSKDIELVSVIPNNCHEQLKCFIPNDEGVLKQIQPLPEPLYGTPCGENKVCFAHKCLPITLETIVID
ncbi:hypothetical protein PV327_009024 [Microctonus hyperodae]|uniref:ADAMTS cysteine-rich domain-containing protein n=1 Tax=Microctonus hyperodae TaxID=165561 RepID=A0AA39FTI8_MICHY|nr:hypothetical protein PV327_009024 [Microctonus hyperodae]